MLHLQLQCSPRNAQKQLIPVGPASARAAPALGALSAPLPPQTLCPLSPCDPPSAVLLGTGLCHTDAVNTSFSQDAGTSPPTVMSNGTAQPRGECWGSAGAGQRCRANCALAQAGAVPQNDPSSPLAIPKKAGPCHCQQWGQPAAACPPCVPLALPWAAAGSIPPCADVSPTGLGVTWQQGQAGTYRGQRHAAHAQHLSSQRGITPKSYSTAGITSSN